MGKTKIGSPKLMFKHLDLTPIQPILWTGLHTEGPGRPVEYNPECDLRALMLRQLEQIPYIKDLVKRLRRDPHLRETCGYGKKAPCEAHFTQMKKRIGVEGFRLIEAWLRHEALKLRRSQPLAAAGLVQAACEDGTDLPAWSSRDPHDTSRGLGDPDARVGRGKKGFLLGYLRLPLAPPLRNPVVGPGHRSIVPEVGLDGLHHRPPEPPAPLPGDAAVTGDASAAVCGRDDARVARQLVTGSEPVYVADLRLHQHRRVVADSGDGDQQPHVLGPGGDAPQLPGQQCISSLRGAITLR